MADVTTEAVATEVGVDPLRDIETATLNDVRTNSNPDYGKVSRVTKLLRWNSLSHWSAEDPLIGLSLPSQLISNASFHKHIYACLGQEQDAKHSCKPQDILPSATPKFNFP